MSSKFILPAILILAAAALGVFILSALKTETSTSSAPPPPEDAVVEVSYTELGAGSTVGFVSPGGDRAPVADVVKSSLGADTVRQPAMKEMVLEVIEEASTTYDVQGLTVLGPLLNHPDPEIREATIEGIVQLGETAGAKTLREAARSARDPQEAREMIEAAKFLELPEYVPTKR